MAQSGYLVERYLPGLTSEEMLAALERAGAESARMAEAGIPVRYLGSILIAGEEACLCYFEGPSADSVAETNERAQAPFTRVTAARWVSAADATRAPED